MIKILLPFSWIFGWIVFIRNWLFDSGLIREEKLPGTVISVGNIAAGGTGKSPIVIEIARMLQNSGARPAIVTRGYRSGLRAGEWQVLYNGRVIAGVDRAGVVADEAMMQSTCLASVPVIIGSQRKRAVDRFLAVASNLSVTHWILDDGFQHRQLARDLDIVLIDARHPSGALFPAGMFREPLSSLRRAHAVILTKAQSVAQVTETRQLIRPFVSCQIYECSFVTGEPKIVCGAVVEMPERWGAIAGISKPHDFIASASLVGISPVRTRFLRDHSPIMIDDLRPFVGNCDAILTTEKDWARSSAVFREVELPTFVLPIVVNWSDKVFKI